MTMGSRDNEEQELDEGLDDSFDSPAMESELEAELIEEWCPVCKEIKPHAIVAGGRIACAACNHERTRDSDIPVSQPIIHSVLTPEDRASADALRQAWERLTAIDESEVLAYSIRLKLEEGEIIRHSKFGVGVVVGMSDATKAEVLFEDGLRLLVCGK